MKTDLKNICWLGHASIKITGSKVIYIDPWNLKKTETPADIILITHSHYDHCDPDSIAGIIKDNTVVIAPSDCLKKISARNKKVIKPQDIVDINGVIIKAVPAYNIGKSFHPRINNWAGYLVTIDGKTIYHAGDTDVIPEMDDIRADIVFLPVGGTYTMNAKEAAGIANKINPETAVPIHYGSVAGSGKDAETFQQLCNCDVKILEEK